MQMHLVLTPTESDHFFDVSPMPPIYTLHVNRCVSIASQRVVAAFCGHRNGCLKERVTNLEKWFIHGKVAGWAESRVM